MPFAFAGYLQVLKCVPFYFIWLGTFDSFFGDEGDFQSWLGVGRSPSFGGSSRSTGASLGCPCAFCEGPAGAHVALLGHVGPERLRRTGRKKYEHEGGKEGFRYCIGRLRHFMIWWPHCWACAQISGDAAVAHTTRGDTFLRGAHVLDRALQL